MSYSRSHCSSTATLFVIKGTVPGFRSNRWREASAYKRLQPVKGVCVRGYLWSHELDGPQYNDHRLRGNPAGDGDKL